MTNIDTDLVEIYKGSYFSKLKKSRAKKVVVFDFDETLGSFVDLEILWSMLTRYNQQNPIDFNDMLDIFPEFMRYGILSILEYLYSKKKSGECYKVYVYTNNKAEKPWVQLIIDYFNHKLSRNIPLFDQIIYAFKINNIHTELGRTTHKKTYNDFIHCTLLPQSTAICFIDDVLYKDMLTERLYYIKPKPYRHHLSTHDLITRFIYSKIGANVLPTDKLRNLFSDGQITYPYSTRESVSIAKHLQKYPQDSVQEVLHNILDFDQLNHESLNSIKNTFSSFGIDIQKNRGMHGKDGKLSMEILEVTHRIQKLILTARNFSKGQEKSNDAFLKSQNCIHLNQS
jgi:hypothetical protein